MSDAPRIDIEIEQGATFAHSLQWMQARKSFMPITGVLVTVPVRLTVVAHGMPDNWPAVVSSVKGMVQLNHDFRDPYLGIVIVADTVELMNVNGVDFDAYTSGGYLEFNQPYDLSVYTGATCQVLRSQGNADILFTLTSPTGVVLDNANKLITLQHPAASTAALNYEADEGWYNLDLTHNTGRVDRVSYGRMALRKK